MSEGTTEVVVAERAVIIEHGRTSLAFADLTDTRVERQLRHERHLIVQRIGQLGTHTSSASRAEYVDPFACMLEIAHVLHHATHPHRHLKCDQAGTHGDVRRGGLWGRDHNELGVRQCLRHRNRHVAGAGGEIKNQHIGFAPPHIGQKLFERTLQTGASP